MTWHQGWFCAFPPLLLLFLCACVFCVRVCFVFSQGMPVRLELKEKAAYCGKLLSRQLSNQTDTTISITLGETNRRQCSKLVFPPKTNRASRFSFRPATPRTGQSDKRLWGWRDGGEGLHGDRPPHRGGSRVYSFISSMGTDFPTEGAAGFIHSSVPWGQTSPQRGQQGLFIHQFHDLPQHSSVLTCMINLNIHLFHDLPKHSSGLWSTHLLVTFIDSVIYPFICSMIYQNSYLVYDLPKHSLVLWSTQTCVGYMKYDLPQHSSVLWSTQTFIYLNIHRFYDLPKQSSVLWSTQACNSFMIYPNIHRSISSMIYPDIHLPKHSSVLWLVLWSTQTLILS